MEFDKRVVLCGDEEGTPLVTDAHVASKLEIMASLCGDNQDQECRSVHSLKSWWFVLTVYVKS